MSPPGRPEGEYRSTQRAGTPTSVLRGLWITRQDPRRANSGELIYSLGLLRALSGTGQAAITVLAHRDADARPLPAGAPVDHGITWHLEGTIPTGRWGALPSPLPSDAWRLGNASQRTQLRTLLREHTWDWVLIDQAACGWALAELPATLPVAYLAHNDEATVRREVAGTAQGSLPMRLALRLDAGRYARLEGQLLARAQLVTAITPRDEAAFLARGTRARTVVLPPGYHVAQPGVPPATVLNADSARCVVLTGAFEWLAKRRNLEAFVQAADGVFQAAGVQLRVVGKADPQWLARLAQAHPWLHFHANVPSIEPYLGDARMGLIPEMLGGGFKLKALDYVFRGLPVASVSAALSGLPLRPGQDAIVADDLLGLAQAIVRHIDDVDALRAMAACAWAACHDQFSWPQRGEALLAALRAARSAP